MGSLEVCLLERLISLLVASFPRCGKTCLFNGPDFMGDSPQPFTTLGGSNRRIEGDAPFCCRSICYTTILPCLRKTNYTQTKLYLRWLIWTGHLHPSPLPTKGPTKGTVAPCLPLKDYLDSQITAFFSTVAIGSWGKVHGGKKNNDRNRIAPGTPRRKPSREPVSARCERRRRLGAKVVLNLQRQIWVLVLSEGVFSCPAAE